MQPTHSSMLRRTSAGTSPRTTTSETAKRPPGFSTRKASRRTASLSADRLMTQFEMIDVDRVVRQRDRFDRALQELDVRGAGLPLVLARQRRASRRSCRGRTTLPVGPTRLRRQQHVDAAARSEVEHRLARLERDERRRVAAAERRGDRVGRQAAGLGVGVEIRGDRIAAAARGRAAAAASSPRLATAAAMAPYFSRTAC